MSQYPTTLVPLHVDTNQDSVENVDFDPLVPSLSHTESLEDKVYMPN